MTTVDELNNAIVAGLLDGPELLGVSSVQVARLAPGQYLGTLVLIRTRPELSAIMADCQMYQFPLHMPLNVMACVSSVIDYLNDREVLPMPNEMTTLVMSGVVSMEALGFRVDIDAKLITSPRVPMASIQAATGRRKQRLFNQLTNWGKRLIAMPWLDTEETDGPLPLGIDFVHVPDLPLDDLADPHLEQAICLAMGWNFVEMVEPESMKLRIAELKQAIGEAQTVISY